MRVLAAALCTVGLAGLLAGSSTAGGIEVRLAAGGRTLWVTTGLRMDGASGKVLARPRPGGSRVSDAAGALLRVDPGTGRARTVLWSTRLGRVTAAFGDAWAADGRTVVRVEGRAGGGVLARIPVGGVAIDVTAGPRNVWVLAFERRRVRLVRVDARANRVTAVRLLPGLPSSVAVSAGGVWVGLLGSTERLLRLDPRTLRVRASVPLL
jgi:hypothetical protein